MYRPYFSVFYISFLVISLLIFGLIKTQIDKTDKLLLPLIPPNIDPYEIAFLRIGTNVVQLHFVGSHKHGKYLIDACADKTEENIWQVFREVCARCDVKGTTLERDKKFPPFDDVLQEIETARNLLNI